MEFKRASNHDINISHTVNGGMIVKVGCAVLTFSSPEDMMVAMGQFYADPEAMEKEYNSVMGPQEVETGADRCDPIRNTVRGMGGGGGPALRSLSDEETTPDNSRHPRNEERLGSGPDPRR